MFKRFEAKNIIENNFSYHLKLDEEVVYSEFIRPACIAAPDTPSWDTKRYKCTVLGWGDTGNL